MLTIKWYNCYKNDNCIECRSLCAILVDCPLNQDVWWHRYGIRMICRSIFHWAWPLSKHSAVKSYSDGIWIYVFLWPEIALVTCKQLTVLWCQTIQISNSMMEGFWVQSSTCEVWVRVKMGLIAPSKIRVDASLYFNLAKFWSK